MIVVLFSTGVSASNNCWPVISVNYGGYKTYPMKYTISIDQGSFDSARQQLRVENVVS